MNQCEFLDNVILTSPKAKTARNLKQQFINNISPKKSTQKNSNKYTENLKDPNYIPYYLINFECIIRGVIDETDDKDLFEDDEIGTYICNLSTYLRNLCERCRSEARSDCAPRFFTKTSN